jgi:hypothetical protein
MTVIYPRLPSGFTIFCDDIRHEVSGKATFVGAYADTMYINGQLPAILPKLAIMIVYREEPQSLEPVQVKVFLPGDDYDAPAVVFEFTPEPELIPEQTGDFLMREARFLWETVGVIIKETGQIRVRAFRGDDEIRLGALEVTLNPAFAAAREQEPNSPAEPEPSEPAGP